MEMRDLAEHALNVAELLGAGYADARVIEQESQELQTKDLQVAAVNLGTSYGMGVRVLKNGGWGFASTQDLSNPGIEKTVRRAVETAVASAHCLPVPVVLAPEQAYIETWSSPCVVDPFSVSLQTKLDLLLAAGKIMKSVKGVTLAQGYMTFVKESKFFASSEGSRIEQNFVRSSCGIESFATDDYDRQKRSYPNSFGGQNELSGWEMVERWDLLGQAQRVGEEAVALLTAPVCPQTVSDIILGGSQLGLQIHESCGHPSELDRALGEEVNFAGASFLTPEKIGQLQYGSPIVNLVADATAAGALGSFGFDDEGVRGQRIYIVKNGLFCGYLSSRSTAHLIGLQRSGGAMRAESWNREPIIRMTNISLEPGNAGSLEDLIADCDDAVLMDTNRSWSIDNLRYNFQFSTEAAWEIKKGKRGRLLKNASYGGITPVFWNSCDAICGQQEYVAWGLPNCGKGQPQQVMWTGHGASPARFRQVQIGMAHAG